MAICCITVIRLEGKRKLVGSNLGVNIQELVQSKFLFLILPTLFVELIAEVLFDLLNQIAVVNRYRRVLLLEVT